MQWDKRTKGYRVKQPNGIDTYRPNKLAAGISFTHYRSNHNQGMPTTEHKRDVLALLVKGTTDVLAGSFGNRMKRHRHKYYKTTTVTRWIRKEAPTT